MFSIRNNILVRNVKRLAHNLIPANSIQPALRDWKLNVRRLSIKMSHYRDTA